MLKVGLSACFMYPDPKRKIFAPKTLLYMGHDMSHYLGLSGVMPILIPDLPNDQLFYQFLDRLDGILLQGGMDIHPEAYGEKPLEPDFVGDRQRDKYEMKILEYAITKSIPLLGICRGMQLMNVYFKGTLYQDLDHYCKEAITHYDVNEYDELVHSIEFTKEGIFKDLYGKQSCNKVNSVHHQGIKKLGDKLLVEAICPDDNIIEAISYQAPHLDSPYAVGMQWHPEFFHTMKTPTISAGPVLQYFLELCRRRNKRLFRA